MVSAWDVYLVMQLDTIRTAAIALSVIGVIASFVTLGVCADSELSLKYPVRVAAITSLFIMAATFLPSSKTAAAMILVPKLTSPEVTEPVGREAKELYGLAKNALRKLGEDKPEAKP